MLLRTHRRLRSRLATGTIISGLALSFAATQALAQDATDPTSVDDVVVTGSRIVRPNLTESTPVQTVTPETLTSQGFENVTDVLTQLPQFAAAFGFSRTQSTFSGNVDSGLNLTNLRNLGPQRSLTLLNGRRFPSGQITTEAVDFNMIPSANIERIEVITGGASAIYGADAVAGVINIITDDDFEGLEIGASYGAAIDNIDNINPSAFIRFGGAIGDRGHVGATLQYDYQGQVRCADRYLCAEDFFWQPPADPIRGPAARSGVGLAGRFFVNGGPAAGYTFRDGQLVTFSTPLDGYNRNADRTLAIPTERILFAANADYRLTDSIKAFVEFNYGSSETNAPFEGHPFQSQNDTISGLIEATIPANNPFIPASLRAVLNGDPEITWWQRFNGLGKRGANNQRQTYRFAAGLTGDLATLGGIGRDWDWEVSYVNGRTTLNSLANGLVSVQALYDGLRVEADPNNPGQYRCVSATARAQGCVPINPFDGYNDAEIAAVTRAAGSTGESVIETGTAFMSGTLADLWAGPLQVALGVESRRTTAFIDYDSDINLGIVTGNQIFDNDRRTTSTNEIFGEFVLPVLSDLPFAQSVNLEGAYRYSDSSVYDAYETWKIGGDWSPIDGLRFRVNQNRSVREPNLGEATGGGETAGVVNDPCVDDGRRTANATRIANCAADGVPVGYLPAQSIEQGVQGLSIGNPNVRPEIADTLTYGVVLQLGQFNVPNWLSSTNLTVDRFEIEIEDLIAPPGRQELLDLCYDTAGAERDQYCAAVGRGAHPLIPAGATYALLTVDDQVVNGASFEIAGFDVALDHQFDTSQVLGRNWGTFNLSSVFTFYDKAVGTAFAGAPPVEFLGYAGGSTASAGYLEVQGNTTVSWATGPFSVTYVNRYIGETKDSPYAATPVTIDAYFYHNLQVQYDFGDRGTAYVGVNNLFDTEPPFFPSLNSGTQALDTIPAYYDVMGRQLYAGFRAKF